MANIEDPDYDAAAEESLTPVADLISLRGRVALVTGGSMGIGLAIARRLSSAGADVALTSRDGQRAAEIASGLHDGPGRVLGVELDVRDAESVRRAVDTVTAELGAIGILVNNAASVPVRPLADTDLELWNDTIATNLTGSLVCSQLVGARMLAGSGGVVVNICSTNSVRPNLPGQGAYTASKHALLGLTRSLAVEYGPAVRVLAVAPGGSDTPGARKAMGEFAAAGMGDIGAALMERLPLRRLPSPDEVARVVLFAVSDLAAGLTGSMLYADGGAMLL